MKKLSMIVMAALLVLAMSCKKEKENESTTQGPGFRATMEAQPAGNNKTHFVPDGEGGGAVVWDANDAIMVVNNAGDANEFTTDGTTDGEGYADFLSNATLSFYTAPFTAYYPASSYNAETGKFTLPQTQDYNDEIANSFGKGFNPMAAQSDDTKLTFKNICGMLELKLTGDCTVKSIRITSKNASEMLWGEADGISFVGGNPACTLSNGGNSITLNVNNAVTLSGDATTFYFVLPAGSLTSGFDVLLTDSNGQVWKRSASTNTVIQRAKIRRMGEQSVEITDPITPTATLTAGCVSCTYTVSATATVPSGSHACEFGVVYSTTDDTPTIEEGAQKLVAGNDSFSGTRNFVVDIAQLTEDVVYYVRAYAMCDAVEYSSDVKTVVYSTPKPLPTTWTNGKNPHPFTVASGKVVCFSQGNLQYNATGASATAAIGSSVGGTWRFANHQFDFVGVDNANVAQTYTGWIDLFGYATSGYNHEAIGYQPWTSIKDNTYYYPYSPYDNVNPWDFSLEDGPDPHTGMADWGVANSISNGVSNNWRTLTHDEWIYIFSTRSNAANLYGEGKVGFCTPGVIILPDDWNWSNVSLSAIAPEWVPGTSDYTNVYSYSDWAKMEAAGAIFLPASGRRLENSVNYVGTDGRYWSSTHVSETSSWYFSFKANYVEPANAGTYRYYGFSVRLVSDN